MAYSYYFVINCLTIIPVMVKFTVSPGEGDGLSTDTLTSLFIHTGPQSGLHEGIGV